MVSLMIPRRKINRDFPPERHSVKTKRNIRFPVLLVFAVPSLSCNILLFCYYKPYKKGEKKQTFVPFGGWGGAFRAQKTCPLKSFFYFLLMPSLIILFNLLFVSLLLLIAIQGLTVAFPATSTVCSSIFTFLHILSVKRSFSKLPDLHEQSRLGVLR